ncbi:hypothetical protein CSC00_3993 [Klebsiella pneumoniae]|nr:hypothetical protein CSC00_3993 [Klebsiella pneumoniae]
MSFTTNPAAKAWAPSEESKPNVTAMRAIFIIVQDPFSAPLSYLNENEGNTKIESARGTS